MQHLQQPCVLRAEDAAFSSLIAYTAFFFPWYRDGWHHRELARKLEAVERGEITRLLISMPPRHGKSMLATENFPAWYLGRNPDKYVISAAYSQELADDFGRKVRNQIADPLFQEIFPGVSLKGDSSSVKRFHVGNKDGGVEHTLAQNGAYYAVGVGGPLTGRGGHVVIIDDPIKNREEADSEVFRKKIKNWYTSTAYTRLMPNGAIIVIQTRWHEDDLSGWLEKEHTEEQWTILKLPAIDKNGKALWTEQYNLASLERIKKAIGARDWSALYQQEPTPIEGALFKDSWFIRHSVRPPIQRMKIYGASDYAVTSNGGDYTVHIVVGVDSSDNLWLLDVWRKQSSADEWVDSWCDLVLKWKPIGWAEETGQIKSGVGPFRNKVAIQRGAYTYLEVFPTRGDKAVRAQSIIGRAAMKGLCVLNNEPWLPDLISECLRFPSGVNDDQVDALGLVGQLLDKMQKGQGEPSPKKPPQPIGTVFLPGAPEPPNNKRIKI